MKRLKILRARIQLTSARMRLSSLRERENKLQNRFHAKSTPGCFGSRAWQKALHAVWRNEEKIERLLELPEVETSAAHWTKLDSRFVFVRVNLVVERIIEFLPVISYGNAHPDMSGVHEVFISIETPFGWMQRMKHLKATRKEQGET